MERTCSRCGKSQPLSEFRTYFVKGKEYRRYVCKSCMDAAATQWRNDNQLRHKLYVQERYQKNRETDIERAKKWNKENPERHKKNADNHYAILREQALHAYGKFCQCCGETEPDFLCIDHVNNDGYLYRKSVKNPETGKFYKVGPHTGIGLLKWLRDHDYPDGFQVLCHNCNHSKKKHGVCIHQLDLKREGVTTIPRGSTAKRREVPTTLLDELDEISDYLEGNDIVSSAR